MRGKVQAEKSHHPLLLPLMKVIRAASEEILLFAYMKTKSQISCAVTMQLISTFVFGYLDSTKSLYFPKAGFLVTRLIKG